MVFIQSASKGYGRMLVNNAKLIIGEMTCNTLILKVSKRKHSAIHACQRYGLKMMSESVVNYRRRFFMYSYR